MYSEFLLNKRLSKVIVFCSSRKQRKPTSLHECLEPPSQRRDGFCRFWLLFLIPVFYYMCLDPYNKISVIFEVPKVFMNGNKTSERIKKIIQVSKVTPNRTKSLEFRAEVTVERKNLPVCNINHTGLRKLLTKRSNFTLVILEKVHPRVKKGGYYCPNDCRSRHKVAIIVPYRNRKKNLAIFLHHMHPFLIKQKLEYQIFVIEQYGAGLFNKGRLFNAGFKEMQKFGKWKCLVFHDVDLLPLDERILYTCPIWPKHMCATVRQKKRDPNFHSLFGGVTSMTLEQYEQVNGYSNFYWGWGGEDNDMFWRLRSSGFPITRCNKTIAEYTELPHVKQPSKNLIRYFLLQTAIKRYKLEGLSTLNYELISLTMHSLHTRILVNVNPYEEDVNDTQAILEHIMN